MGKLLMWGTESLVLRYSSDQSYSSKQGATAVTTNSDLRLWDNFNKQAWVWFKREQELETKLIQPKFKTKGGNLKMMKMEKQYYIYIYNNKCTWDGIQC